MGVVSTQRKDLTRTILCKSKNKVVAEYVLRDIRKPVGVSEHRLTEALPKRLRDSLPAIEQLEAELKNKNPP